MEANMTPINDSTPQPQPRFLQQDDDDEEEFQQQQHPPPPPPHFFNPPQMYPVHDKTLDIFTGFDKTAYVIIFVAFILGFFMGKTMQPVILRPT
jgi:hypothetical protein